MLSARAFRIASLGEILHNRAQEHDGCVSLYSYFKDGKLVADIYKKIDGNICILLAVIPFHKEITFFTANSCG